MKCPFCGYNQDKVLDTRDHKDGASIRRRRECLSCKARYSTIETISVSFPLIIKKDGRREPFNKEKILRGIQASCQKRPVSLVQMESVVERISTWVLHKGDRELASNFIGQRVMRELRLLDDVAYIRFASVYRTFQDVQEFVETLEDRANFDYIEETNQLVLKPNLNLQLDLNLKTKDGSSEKTSS